MKILAAGDIHGDSMLSKKLAQMALDNDVDLVLLCGDLTYMDSDTEGIIGPFKEAGKKVLILPGNHESNATIDFLSKAYDVKNLHGYSFKYDDIGIFGCSSVNIGIHAMSEEDIFEHFRSSHEKISYNPKKLMVSHVHPKGTMIERMSSFVPGSAGVRKAIERFSPDMMICSHVHEASGIEEMLGRTRIINVGSEGKIIDL